MRRRHLLVGAAMFYVVGLLAVGLWPTHVDQNLDMASRPPTSWVIEIFDLTAQQGYRIGEFAANIALFVPLGALAILLAPRLGWWHVALLGGLVSVGIEVAQNVVRPERTASLSDVVANTAGAAAGAALVTLWRLARRKSPATS